MHPYVRRILAGVLHFAVVLFGVSFLSFSLLFFAPRSPAELWLAGSDGNIGLISKEALREQEKKMGLDRPLLIQYVRWAKGAVKGDLGNSIVYHTPVRDELKKHAVPTIRMTFAALILTFLFSVPLGFLSAWYRGRLPDTILRIVSFFGISAPSFLISILLLWIFCIRYPIFPIIPKDGISGLVLPSMVLIVQFTAKFQRQVRAVVLEQLEAPYTEGARSRGVPVSRVIAGHILPNALPAILSYFGLYIGLAFGGSAIIEGVFSVNGLGKMIVEAVARMDIYVIQGFVLWTALIYLSVNLLTELISAWIDPRIRIGKGKEEL